MSRIIELSNTQIKNPSLLPAAIQNAGSAIKETIESRFKTHGGHISSGDIFVRDPNITHEKMLAWKKDNPSRAAELERKYPGYFAPDQKYLKSNLRLEFSGPGNPEFDETGVVINGHFRLTGDEDFQHNLNLGKVVSDHYQAQVVKQTLESLGQHVILTVNETGAIQVDGFIAEEAQEEALAVAGY